MSSSDWREGAGVADAGCMHSLLPCPGPYLHKLSAPLQALHGSGSQALPCGRGYLCQAAARHALSIR